MVLGEVFLAAFLQVLLDRLTPREILNYFGRLHGFEEKLKKWNEMLSAIQSVLCDAEEKQSTSKHVELWLEDLRDLAYDVEDVLDKFATEMLRRKVEEHQETGTSNVRSLMPTSFTRFSPKNTGFLLSMESDIKEITNRLQDISERKDKIGLSYNVATASTKAWKRPPSSSLLGGPVVGRDGDKMKIVELLSRDEPSTINFHVVAIVGMPGVGKTTLAQLVFKESNEAMDQFYPKVWVSVSDDFDIVRVTKAILESVTSQHCDLEEFGNVQDCLRKEIAGKKFLIVLDDVWDTCDYDLWTKLQSPFRFGGVGSKILVTTRETAVAKMMAATGTHDLECISNDDCWRVFEQHAFPNVDMNGRSPHFELLKKKIVAKCSGLPLAARTLGGLLRCKEIDEWEEILSNKLGSSSDKTGILPVLRLSYYYLPSNLKRCFAYCSILPNDYEFGEKQLILLWMAEGLIQQPEESKQMEDLGGDYFQELLSRSLFQKSSKSYSKFVMHDLVSELAKWAAGDICCRLEEKLEGRFSPKTRHSSYIPSDFDGVKRFEAFSEVKHLRTFLPLSFSQCCFLTRKVTCDLLPKLQYLRVLSLSGYGLSELPNSIGILKHVRYLDLSHTRITSLPETICTLYNLQTLILKACYGLKELPAKMRNLVNLRHLSNSDIPLLGGMPPQMGRLTNLQTLHHFAVGVGGESGAREIGPLLQLRGTLRLSRLENVTDAEDARRADLISKEGLDALLLEWSGTREMESVVLDLLQPHRKLRELIIKHYGGLKFSAWIGDPLFCSMVVVRLDDCNNCQFLPPLGQLPSLKELYIRRMSGVESVGLEFYGDDSLPFPLLETLEIWDMPRWKGWFPCRQEGLGAFPCLKRLSIQYCCKLEGKLPENLDSLENLEIYECEQLDVSISNYKQLRELAIHGCKRVVHRSVVDFELLESMRLLNIPEPSLLPERFMKGLTKVKNLNITGCEEFASAWKNEDMLLQQLTSLRHLVIRGNSHLVELLGKEAEQLLQTQVACKLLSLELRDCQSLLKVPEGLHHLTSLQELHIFECRNLISFPEGALPPSLKVITITLCHSLMYVARHRINPSLRRIEIQYCPNLKSLVEEAEGLLSSSTPSMHEEESCLEYLRIDCCQSLVSLSSKGQLPRVLKHLQVLNCVQLESITDRFHDSYCLEYIEIFLCPNLKSLPEGLCRLTNLQKLIIRACGSLVSFLREGLPRRASNLRQIEITNSDEMEVLPKGTHSLNSLQILKIPYCASFLEEGFPLNLTSLEIQDLKSFKPLLEWGLHRLTSLRHLKITGEDPVLVSFPPDKETVLPKSLIELKLRGFPNLRYLSSRGFHFLTSLESLEVRNCPMLVSIPKEGLPLSLTQLCIAGCPLLQERCKPFKGRYWPSIAHIPYIHW